MTGAAPRARRTPASLTVREGWRSLAVAMPQKIAARIGSRVTACLALLAAVGCQGPGAEKAEPLNVVWESPASSAEPAAPTRNAPTVVNAAASRPAGVPASAPAAPAEAAIATVNGEAIRRSAFLDALIEAHGVDMLEKFIMTAALRQKAAALGLAVSETDVQAEYDDALRRITAPFDAPPSPDSRPVDFDRAAAERVLEEFLVAKNIARSEFNMRMRQNAYLRKIAEREVKVDDALLPDEYKRAYGEKVQVRCIQVSTPEAVKRVRAALDEGKDFELVARQMSENRVVAARGGMLPPFTRFDDVPRLLRDAAFALEPGQVSATIHENNQFFILRLERRFPPSEVGIENVRDELRARIRDRLVRQRMDLLAGEVFRDAAVRIHDPALRDAFRKRYPETRPGRAEAK